MSADPCLAFAKRTVATAIRETCAEARRSACTLEEVLVAFEALANVVENPHPFGEFVRKPYLRDESPHGTLWSTDDGDTGNGER